MLINKDCLDKMLIEATKSTRKRFAYCLHESKDSNAQRLFNALIPGTEIPIHRHTNKAETYIIVEGKVCVLFYNEDGSIRNQFMLEYNSANRGIHIPKMVWHSIIVYEPSVIFEVNDGPYTPITNDDILKQI